MSIRVDGAEDFATLAKTLRRTKDKDLEQEMDRGLAKAAKPFIRDVRKSAIRTLPSEGGLNERVARSPITVKKSTGHRAQGVRIVAGGRRSRLSQIDKGKVRHPVYGNRKVWVTQPVRPGFWSRPEEEHRARVVKESQRALQRVADKVGRR